MMRELSCPFARRTLMQSERHVGQSAADVANEDTEVVDATGDKGAIPEEDYLVNQTPPQYHRNHTPPRSFHPDPSASSSTTPQLVTRGDLEEYFQRMLMDFFIPVMYSVVFIL
ncbi:hypothetical protein F0562_007430 [Nyssa sinensis]|uniref:Uncharacterized protein n=1 Tax=Nyssa sinensis TaxID=561372 RepID=A0A5J5A3C7_9ASTE|nr:hypothetical protein F0562_007430 [Nyssa sinensis]